MAALLLVAKTTYTYKQTWKQPQCPPISSERIELSYIHILEFYVGIKKNELELPLT